MHTLRTPAVRLNNGNCYENSGRKVDPLVALLSGNRRFHRLFNMLRERD